MGGTSRLAQDVQVNGRVLDQLQQAAVDVLDDHPLLGLPLPAALHQLVHLLGAGAGPLQFPALRDAFNGLLGVGETSEIHFLNSTVFIS